MAGTFQLIEKWTASNVSPERQAWTMDLDTKEIRWGERRVIPCLSNQETARLQDIFEEMISQLSYPQKAKNGSEMELLSKLSERVTERYERFNKAHQSFFGLIYCFFFAYSLSDYYKELKTKIAELTASSLSSLDFSTLSAAEIDKYCRMVQNMRYPPSLHIDWSKLSLDQLKSVYVLAPHANGISLSDLDKDKATFLLEQDGDWINRFRDIDANTDKIEPRFLSNLSFYRCYLSFSKLDFPQLLAVIKNKTLSSSQLSQIRFKDLTASEMMELANANPRVISEFPADQIADLLPQLEPKWLQHLSYTQMRELDASKLTGDQAANLAGHGPFSLPFKVKKLNLSAFTATQISAVFSSNTYEIRELSPATVASNLSKFDPKLLNHLSTEQIDALNFSALTVEQIINLSSKFSSTHWQKIDLSLYTKSTIERLFSALPSSLYGSVVSWFSPATVAANIHSIPSKYYKSLSDAQLRAIDYNSLTSGEKAQFFSFDLGKMKNYPKQNPHSFYYDFFGSFNGSGSASFFGQPDPFSDDFWKQYFSQAGGTYHQPNQPAQDPKWNDFRIVLDAAVAIIKKRNKTHANQVYEALRLKCLTKADALKKEPRLVFTDQAQTLDEDSLKKAYKKMVIAFHPDKNQDNIDEATELFRVVNEAYKGLTN
jgi:hypothetical protein